MAKKATRSPAPRRRTASSGVAATAARAPRQEALAVRGQVEKGLGQIGRAIADVRRGLGQAERRIEADARRRIRDLRKEARKQMRALEAMQREGARLLGRISAAAGGSWSDITKTADSMVAEARATAGSVIDRFKSVIG